MIEVKVTNMKEIDRGDRAATPRRSGGALPRFDTPLVPRNSISGRALIAVVAIMTFLASLTTGAVMLVGSAASEWQSDVSREVTIQIIPAPGRDLDVAVAKAAAAARAFPGIGEARVYSKEESSKLLEPWLGNGLSLDELPVPRLVVVKIAAGAAPDIPQLRLMLTEQVPGATLDDHRGWVGRMRTMALELDLAYRPWKDGFAMRRWVLKRVDPGNYNKGILGGWQIDQRDPTADIRLLEFCLAVPTEQYARDGKLGALAKDALADRVPQLVLNERRKGLQAPDWHEHLTAARERITAEIARLEACAPATQTLDLARMRKLVEDWPAAGWEKGEIMSRYRMALLRGISTGYFLRRSTGGNA